MTPRILDPSPYLKHYNGELIGMIGTYVDGLNTGTPAFDRLTETTIQRFDSKKLKYDNFGFFGVHAHTTADGSFEMYHSHYCESMSMLKLSLDTDYLRRARALLVWLTHTKPELACLTKKSAQITEGTLPVKLIKALNKGIQSAMSNPHRGVQYVPLTHKSIHLRIYMVASFASNDDFSSEIRFIVLMRRWQPMPHRRPFEQKVTPCRSLHYGR